MAFFSTQKKTESPDHPLRRVAAGYITLQAFWALLHAGVLTEMSEGREVDAADIAARGKLSPVVLRALLDYLAAEGLVAFSEDHYTLSATGEALLAEQASLEFLRAYQPVLHYLEHFLGQLKHYGNAVARRPDAIANAADARYADSVYPAMVQLAAKAKATAALDLGCGTGALLLQLAQRQTKLTGVGLCAENLLTERATATFAEHEMQTRLTAVTGAAGNLMENPARQARRMGIPETIWETCDCVLACGVLGDLAADRPRLTAGLRALRKSLPHATFIIAEACDDEPRQAGALDAEMALLLALSNHQGLSTQQWETILAEGGMEVSQRRSGGADGVVIFVCREGRS